MFKEDTANNGDSVTIKEELLDENGGVIDSVSKTYTAKKATYSYNDSNVLTFGASRDELIDPSKPAKNNLIRVHKVQVYDDSNKTKPEGSPVEAYFSPTNKAPEGAGDKATFERPKNLRIEVKLPEGVELGEGGDSSNWTYDAATRTITRNYGELGQGDTSWTRYNEIGVTANPILKFKSIPAGQVVNLDAKFTVNVGLPNEYKLPDRTLPIKFDIEKVVFAPYLGSTLAKDNLTGVGNDPFPYKLDEGVYTLDKGRIYDNNVNDQTDNGMIYTLKLGNENNGSSPTDPTNGKVMHVWSIDDVLIRDKQPGVPNKIYYKNYQLGRVEPYGTMLKDDARHKKLVEDTIKNFNDTPNKLYGVKEDGTKVEIASNIKYQQKIDVNNTAGDFVRLSLEFERPLVLDNTSLLFYVGAYPTDKEIKNFEDSTYDATQYYYGTSEAKVEENQTLTTTRETATTIKEYSNGNWAVTGLALPTPKSWMSDLSGDKVITYKSSGSFANVLLSQARLRGTYGAWGPYLGKPVTNIKAIYLLPPEFSYVQTNATAGPSNPSGISKTPEVIDNFRNTGRQAVIFSVPDINPNLENKDDEFAIDIKIKASQYAQQGNNRVDAYVTYDNNKIIQPWDGNLAYTDQLDLDGDGDKREQFIHRAMDINFIPPLELLIAKRVGLDTASMKFLEIGDLGEEFYWKVEINNNTIAEMNDISFIDTLPFVGDNVIVPNKQNVYKPRGSQFNTPLTRSLESVPENAEVLKNFDVFYQLAPQNALEAVRDGEWLAEGQITDFTKVKSIKIQLKPGKVLASKTTANFFIPSKIPYDSTLTSNQTANNTVAMSTDKTFYSEANMVRIGVAKYVVKGTVFSDFNKNGVINDNEPRLAGYKVELIDKKTGDVAVDVNGNKLEATTDNEGKYSINAYKRGDYFVRFTKLNNDDKLTKSNDRVDGNNAIEEIAGTNYVKSADFALNPTNDDVIKNAGFEATKRDVTIEKVDSQLNQDGSKKYLKGATFELRQNGNAVYTATTGENGRAVFKDVKFGSYKLVETKEPNGYKPNTEEKDITVDENGDAKYEIQNELALKSISGTVKWEDANNQDGKRPEKVTVTLNKTVDGTTTKVKDIEVPTSDADTSNYEFTDLPQYEGGKEITYTVEQNSVDGYTTKVDGFNIVNKHEPEKTVVEGTKTWNDADDQDGVRPAEITIKLFKNGTEVTTKKVTEADGWKWKFENLDKYYDKGKEVKYTIEEDKVEKYTTEVNGFNVTNTHEPEKTFVEGTKTWDDANNQDGKRPSEITIRLFKNGTEVEVKKVTEADGWKWKFENLDKYYNKGKVVEYTIKEDKVDEYTTEVNGFNVTNKHLPERTIVSGTKTWDDANDQDGKRPNSIKVILNKTVDGVTTKVEVKEVTKQDNWHYAFNLPKYENGKVIRYSIDEEDVPGYTKTINGHNLKNTHIPAPKTSKKPKSTLAKTGLAETSTTLLGTMLLALAMLFRRKSTK